MMLLGVLFLLWCLWFFREELALLLSVPLKMVVRVALTAYAIFDLFLEVYRSDDWFKTHERDGTSPT